jgi:hypothetical protein
MQVGLDAKLFVGLADLLPDRVMDLVLYYHQMAVIQPSVLKMIAGDSCQEHV